MHSSRTRQATQLDATERIRRLEEEYKQVRHELGLVPRDRHDGPSDSAQEKWREWSLRSILDHLPAMVGYWDKDLRNRFSNRAYLTWFGIDPEVIPGMHIRDVIGEDRYRLNRPYLEGVLRGEAQQFQRMIPAPDGSRVRHSLIHYIPDILDGVVQGFYVLASETTALHDAHEALRASEERYRAVIEHQTDLISRIAADGSFTFVNNVYSRFFGKTADELIGHSWTPVCHPDDLPHVEAQLAMLSPANPTVIIENRVCSASGEVHWMQFVNRGLFDAAGHLFEIQSVGRDISDRKKAEDALREAHADLEQRVVERTEQLRHQAIQTTLAEERERQSIARDLHDGLGQLLHVAKIKLDELTRKLPRSASAAGAELNTLLADASRMTRSLTSQLSPPILGNLGLPQALRWLGQEMERLYGLHVVVGGEDTCPPLTYAQESILFRSARELLINVSKHSGVAQAALDLSMRGRTLTLTVADAGIGFRDIPGALQTQCFGLASIRERLTYLGGETEIVSTPGTGVRVTLRMPVNP